MTGLKKEISKKLEIMLSDGKTVKQKSSGRTIYQKL